MNNYRPASHAVVLLYVLVVGIILAGCQEATTPGAATERATGASGVAGSDGAPDPAVDKSPAAPIVSNRLLDLSFDDIKFEMEKTEPFQRSMLTEKIEGYAGRKIRIRGYMLPSFVRDGITKFVLVRDNLECCFGPGAALYDCVMVQLQPGKSTSYSVRPIAVTGKFSISEWRDFDGAIRAIYHLEGQKVEQ
ncbi:MAG: DUF3299 domain-containing protein [Planctomycetota bacterium]|nr:DUF3299 domain-containing protein [Planctomycetota bacterium]